MASFEQYEGWQLRDGRWEFTASFQDFEVAKVMARRPSYRARLMLVTYENGKAVQKEVLSEMGAMREQP